MKALSRTPGTAPWLPYICTLCRLQFQQSRGVAYVSHETKLRRITDKHHWKWKYGDKLKAAEEEWQAKAKEIAEGKQDSMLSVLEQRGYINQVTGYAPRIGPFELSLTDLLSDRDDLDMLMTKKRIGAYVGVDPTASSLHLGHLLPLMALYWMYIHGYQAVTLVRNTRTSQAESADRH